MWAMTEIPSELAARIVGGDRAAFRQLLERHDDRLRRLAARMLAGDPHRVDDVMQEAYVRAYQALPSFRGDADLGTWLYRITTTACLDELRRGRRRPQPVDVAAIGWDRPSAVAGPEQAVSTADAVARALAAVPEDQRAAVVLVDGEGFDYDAAAEELGIATGTLASRLSRARSALRSILTDTEEQ
jgi:RNA polymerase sigma-70 factor (ECF subfamily)